VAQIVESNPRQMRVRLEEPNPFLSDAVRTQRRAIRLAASTNRSISRSVRCSRERYAALGLRTGKVTAHFSEVGRITLRW
jgi:hypothetical protein